MWSARTGAKGLSEERTARRRRPPRSAGEAKHGHSSSWGARPECGARLGHGTQGQEGLAREAASIDALGLLAASRLAARGDESHVFIDAVDAPGIDLEAGVAVMHDEAAQLAGLVVDTHHVDLADDVA